MSAIDAGAYMLPGLTDPVMDSQRIFRAALEAFSSPGQRVHLPVTVSAPAPLAHATAAFLLTMADFETPIWLQERNEALLEYLRFHCGARFVEKPHEARFAVVTQPAAMPDLNVFNPGEPEYPDHSTTVLIQMSPLGQGDRVRLSGPGIAGASLLELGGLPPGFWAQWQRNERLFPCGVDVLFTYANTLFAVPRTAAAEV